VLGRLRRLMGRADDGHDVGRPLNTGPTPGCTSVVFDSGKILLYQADGRCGSISWSELGSVIVATTEDGPTSPDLFWLLLSKNRERFLAVPIGAVGEQDLLLAMQMRLRDFRNEAVIEAMASTATAHYVAWEAAGETH
jgi:hypothetical protein